MLLKKESTVITVLKIGGSAITDKSSPFGVAKQEIIDQISREISQCKKAILGKLILVHGAGSFGHPIAKQYGLDTHYTPTGVIKTRNSVKQLHTLFVDSLVAHGVPAVSVEPFSCIICKSGTIASMQTEIISRILAVQLVPVLFGDVALDLATDTCILSGDQIASYIAQTLHIPVIGAGSSEDGVYDAQGNIIPNISYANFTRLRDAISGSKHMDITGGMLGKVCQLLQTKGTTSYVFNATKPGNISAFLQSMLETKHIGTKITTEAHNLKLNKNISKTK